jgi:SPP1 family phage portal protein
MYLWDKISGFFRRNAVAAAAGPDKALLEREIAAWLGSPERVMQIKGHLYYSGEQDILSRRRTAIGENGQLQPVENLPNNRVIDNQYAKLVNQKANYLLGQPFVLECENKQYLELLRQALDRRFMRTLKNAGKMALCGGIAWLYPYFDGEGKLAFRLFPAYEMLPFWQDSEHNTLSWAVRFYQVWDLSNGRRELQDKVEVYSLQGVQRYIWKGGSLKPDKASLERLSYVQSDVGAFNWQRLPLIALKYNESESPLLRRVKSLQDGINVMLSDFENNMQEDARNTILVIKNYDGTNLGEFRRNLAAYGAVKVRYDGETKGGVETLEVKVNAENYKVILELFKKALIENGMGFDAKDDRLSGNPNQMNIQSMYSDIDLDANDMETELQAAFADILWFVNVYLANTGLGDFFNEQVNVIFNRDMLMDESSIIANCRQSVGILSDETIIGQHPWVDDVQQELERLAKQRQAEATDPYFGGEVNADK